MSERAYALADNARGELTRLERPGPAGADPAGLPGRAGRPVDEDAHSARLASGDDRWLDEILYAQWLSVPAPTLITQQWRETQ